MARDSCDLFYINNLSKWTVSFLNPVEIFWDTEFLDIGMFMSTYAIYYITTPAESRVAPYNQTYYNFYNETCNNISYPVR